MQTDCKAHDRVVSIVSMDRLTSWQPLMNFDIQVADDGSLDTEQQSKTYA
jgi:hypothetical protein